MKLFTALLLFSVAVSTHSVAENIIRTPAPVTPAQGHWFAAEPMYGEWMNAGNIYGCSNWSPSEINVPAGQEFTQMATDCLHDQNRTVQPREQNSLTHAFRNSGPIGTETLTITNQQLTRTAIGTMEELYSHYRIIIDSNQIASGYARIVELELLDSSGIDLFDAFSVISRSSSNYGVSFGPEKAIDNDGVDRWTSSSAGGTDWVSYEFPQKVKAHKVSIQNYPSTAGNYQQPKDFRIQGSIDGSTWVTLKTVTNEIDWTGGERRVFDIY